MDGEFNTAEIKNTQFGLEIDHSTYEFFKSFFDIAGAFLLLFGICSIQVVVTRGKFAGQTWNNASLLLFVGIVYKICHRLMKKRSAVVLRVYLLALPLHAGSYVLFRNGLDAVGFLVTLAVWYFLWKLKRQGAFRAG